MKDECLEAGIPAKGEMGAVKAVADERGRPAEIGKETKGSGVSENRGDGSMDGVKKAANAGRVEDTGFGNYNTQSRESKVDQGRVDGSDYSGQVSRRK